MLAALTAVPLLTSAYVAPGANMPARVQTASRAGATFMDETIMEKAWAGELAEEGAENVFMTEVGWATYLDDAAGSSYNLNQRPSQADDGYFTPTIFSNPVDGERPPRCQELSGACLSSPCAWLRSSAALRGQIGGATRQLVRLRSLFTPFLAPWHCAVFTAWLDSMKGVVDDPLSVSFPTISNDQSGARSYPKGATEIDARTIKPKVKDFDPNLRVVGIPGLNLFGTPSSKQDDVPF
jgi:hypothetical protein